MQRSAGSFPRFFFVLITLAVLATGAAVASVPAEAVAG